MNLTSESANPSSRLVQEGNGALRGAGGLVHILRVAEHLDRQRHGQDHRAQRHERQPHLDVGHQVEIQIHEAAQERPEQRPVAQDHVEQPPQGGAADGFVDLLRRAIVAAQADGHVVARRGIGNICAS
ncbi:MAG: hypothetical protein NTW86_20405 [Candidatus Sumerlaeota bacterium]|nr:hypothetical protein [Candidatus Sumerlaeota bacterium]